MKGPFSCLLDIRPSRLLKQLRDWGKGSIVWWLLLRVWWGSACTKIICLSRHNTVLVFYSFGCYGPSVMQPKCHVSAVTCNVLDLVTHGHTCT